MDLALGLLILALTLYTSSISYAMRAYSRSQLTDRLDEPRRAIWLDRLDRHENQLQVVSSVLRLLFILVTVIWAYAKYFGINPQQVNWTDFVLPTLLNLILLLVIAIGIPHALALHSSESILAGSLPVLWVLRYPLMPIERTLTFVEFVVRRLLGKTDGSDDDESARIEREILDAVSEGEAHGAVDEEQKEMIRSVIELHETTVSEIMTPRTDMIALSVDASSTEVRETIVRAGHSRIPVYEGSLDEVIGVLYAKDLIGLKNFDQINVRELMRAVPFVPETKSIDHLLHELRRDKVHIAVVLDEYGGTAGLVTIEDIIEELVGEIDDEYDRRQSPSFQRIDENTLEVDGRIPVYEINEELSIEIPDDGDYETIGGFVFSALGKIPATGEEFTHRNIHFAVVEAEPRRINRLRIQVQRETQSA